jgi:hypothetical protein
MRSKQILIGIGVTAVAAFLLGFLPQYSSARQLRAEAAACQVQLQANELAVSIGRVYLDTMLKNYGLAAQAATPFFDRLRNLSGQDAGDPELRQFVSAGLAQRDAIVGGLAKGDPAVLTAIQDLFKRAVDIAGRKS